MNNTVIYFTLRPSIHAARFENSIIILNSDADTYLSVIDDAARYFVLIVQQPFVKNGDGAYQMASDEADHGNLNFWIVHFLERQFIVQSDTQNIKPMQYPLKAGGLCDYRWDTKPSWKPFGQVSTWQLLEAWILLARVHWAMKRSGTKGLLALINSYAAKYTPLQQPTDQESATLAATVDAASVLYLKKTFCLAWSATYVCMALKRGWAAQLVIGVQTNPFYAHAWAEISGKVIHDDPEIAQVLSVILKSPFSQVNRGL